jgi:diadenosine tetraphosphate (Ap4A) HIT family hydrolase/5-methylcytosine-specific restriction endonuclease McrA
MLIELIKSSGKTTGRKIAKSFLDYDETQIEYYQNITKQMPFKFLSKHLKEIKRDKENYTFEGFDLTESQKQELIELCKEQLDKYINKRGIDNILQHRKKSSGYISGSIRYEVLKRAKTKCEWCGISNEERAIEVDHIIPRSKGGKDELYNFQALCYVCNTQKSNKDDTNVRKIKDSYNDRDKECIFCNISKNKIIKENELAVVIEDNYPVTKNHSLIISKRHCSNYFDLYQPEINACNQLIFETREQLLKKDKSIEGFNIGNNSGEVAGQTISHCHIHLIPRRKRDTDNPRGGVRGVIQDKQSY